MLNPAHILEIALLLLVAFLSGAVVGALARLAASRLMPTKAPASSPVAVVEPAKPEGASALVAAPVISEVVKTPTPVAPADVPALDFTEALLALAGDKPGSPASKIQMPSIAPLPAVAVTKTAEPMRPARVAGETTSGHVVAHPRSSAVPVRVVTLEGASAEVIPFPLEKLAVESLEPAAVVAAVPMPAAEPASPVVAGPPAVKSEPVVEVEVAPPVEAEAQPDAATAVEAETAASLELPAADAEADAAAANAPLEQPPAAVAEIAQPAASPLLEEVAVAPEPITPAAPETSAEDDEAAAMRAIEGNWSPRRAASPRTRRVDLPEVSAEAIVVDSLAAVTSATEAANPGATAELVEAPGRPVGIAAPRLGVKDDLTHVIGILPIIETALNRLGLYHFDQIAELTDDNAGWIENHLGIAGRIAREHWREQARGLAPATVETKKAAGQQ
ncbi:hypothetical protein ASC89_10985 [Devosia sp. Root413D1]|uniref:hypothetical protein n=1 Tax=unclassified Devosia TaxID=196773 RepID=UPI0006F31217|nr:MULTISPECIES: hypothetical protein [unclassified Devosia]KQU99411.1 hypothetical protein ASC68_08600 [Devosia sp. Root105]KQW80571.1 hypothetical protein ASC89_10985 [Devosia sp. Root413D1]